MAPTVFYWNDDKHSNVAGWEGMCEETNHMIMKTTVCANYGYIYYNHSLC
jgi:hypothetical protein